MESIAPAPLRYRIAAALLAAGVAAVALWLWAMPLHVFDVPYSLSVHSADGTLLGARIAADGQWRFAPSDSVPRRFAQCVRLFEDEWFYRHPGVNPASLVRAAAGNVRAGRVVSGGSTISMQVARLAGGRRRTLWAKLMEMAEAVRMEQRLGKDEIMSLYASHAPFGGNVVGLEAASWRYFGRRPQQLSWAECALLAVLPNAPALIHPGRNREALMAKRNRLLVKLRDRGLIDADECRLSMAEPLPAAAGRLPDEAPHVVDAMAAGRRGGHVVTTLDARLQQRCRALAERHCRALEANEIHNVALLVAETPTGRVRAYVGNAGSQARDVDIVRSRRSTGSLLKPMLYAAALDRGLILPHSLLPDIPTVYSDYRPENYSRTFDGAVPASKALSRSLNVPAVRLLYAVGEEAALAGLRRLGLAELDRPASHYGLSLILGGGESTLWSLCGAYASMARTLTGFCSRGSFYLSTDIRPLSLIEPSEPAPEADTLWTPPVCSAGAISAVLDALAHSERPEQERGWERFADRRDVAWKTGTSFGFRDAWAIGTTPQYTVAVWVGNADGEGRPGIVGGVAAAPLMFEVFGLLPATTAFPVPLGDLKPTPVCRASGCLPAEACPDVDTVMACLVTAAPPPVCRAHRLVHLDAEGRHRVVSDCYPVAEMQTVPWFVLPPVEEYYYRRGHPDYRPLPPVLAGCPDDDDCPIGLISPQPGARVYLPTDVGGVPQQVVFEATHRTPDADLFWYMDERYVGSTRAIHQLALRPDGGHHRLTIVDAAGHSLTVGFDCLNR